MDIYYYLHYVIIILYILLSGFVKYTMDDHMRRRGVLVQHFLNQRMWIYQHILQLSHGCRDSARHLVSITHIYS